MGEQLTPGKDEVDVPETAEGRTPEIGEEEKHQPLDAVMVFGIGPVQPKGEIGHEGKGHAYQLVPEAKLNAIAAATLYLEGKTRKIIFTGGKTGKMSLGKDAEGRDIEPHPYPQSEAEQMARYVVEKFGIPQEAIIVEDKAANTIENISRSLTPIDQNPDQFARLGFLGSHHHVRRIEKMVELFGLEGPTMSSAAVLDRSRAESADRPRDQRVHRRMERYRQYLETTLNPDLNPTYHKRLMEEERWSYGLDNKPSYFLPQLRFIEDDKRLKSILRGEKLAKYLEQYGIEDIETADAGKLRQILGGIIREIPDETWEQMPAILPPEWRYDETKITGAGAKLDEIGRRERDPNLPSRERFQHLNLVIFSDVDGTLNSRGGYTQDTRDAIREAEQANSVIILSSSREGPNLVDIQNELGISPDSPIIFENGGGVYFPKGILTLEEIKASVLEVISGHFEVIDGGSCWLIELARPKEELLEAFEQIKPLFQGEVKLVPEMTLEEVAELYSVSREAAENILREDKRYMYNFSVKGEVSPDQEQTIKDEAQKRGLHITRAVSWHLMSEGRHKGEAVKVTSHLIRKLSRGISTIAMGDSFNDLEMFAQCDTAYNVGKKELGYNSRMTASKGPEGWAEAIGSEVGKFKIV